MSALARRFIDLWSDDYRAVAAALVARGDVSDCRVAERAKRIADDMRQIRATDSDLEIELVTKEREILARGYGRSGEIEGFYEWRRNTGIRTDGYGGRGR